MLRPGAVIELTRAFPRHECAYAGQRAKVWRVEADGGLYVELRCGHPLSMPADWPYKTISNPDEPAGSKEQKTMAKKAETETARQAVIPNNKGIIPVQGFSDEVAEFKTNLKFHEQLGKIVDAGKKRFRALAADVIARASGEVRRVEFLSKDGSVVPVSMSDPNKAGNRTSISSDLESEVAQLGLDINELGVHETETKFVLSGPFVKWFRENVLQPNYVAKGLPVPDDIEEKSVKRLSVEGVAKLRLLAAEGKTDQERAAAALILSKGIKAASVSAK